MNDDEDDINESCCPQCGAWVVDLDGFGVLRHEACGWCAHPSVTGGLCGLCGAAVEDKS